MKFRRHVIIYSCLMALIGALLSWNSPLVRSQTPTPQRIESDDPSVARAGNWTSQTASQASGGSYLYSSGADDDMLTLEFSGPSIEVIFVAGPSLGTLAINVDDIVLRTVMTTADQTAYQQSSRIDYLSDEPHTLKVYAQAGGVVVIDAFVIPAIPPADAGNTSGESRETYCAPINQIHRVSLTSRGTQANGNSYDLSISADGRYVAFDSLALLVPIDTDGNYDIYVYDRKTCTLQLVSVSSTGVKGNGFSQYPKISSDGRYVTFVSYASNLVGGDSNGQDDIFVHDRQTNTTTRVSVSTASTQADAGSFNPTISANGRYIAFQSYASNLVGGDSNGQGDIFLRDRQTAITSRISVAANGAQADNFSDHPAISADGRYIAYRSLASNLVSGDTNGTYDVFVYDRLSTTPARVSIASDGTQGNMVSFFPAISGDGRYVAFHSHATNLVANDTNAMFDVFVHDRQTATTTRVSVASDGTQANRSSNNVVISADGRFVAFHSHASNLVSGDTNEEDDVFVHDRQTGTTTRVSVAYDGTEPNDMFGGYTAISGDGQTIGFTSAATNLVANDTNLVNDIFITPRIRPAPDSLTLFNPPFNYVSLLATLVDNPPYTAFTAFSAYAPVNNGQWVMGDWNGDGLDTPGVYRNGVFYFTNKSGESLPADWGGFWIGITGPVVAGHFSGAALNDCIGAVDSGVSGGVTIFALYFTCDMSGTTLTPALSFQWLSAPLPDPTFSGTHQFMAGDFNGDGLDSIAVRRGEFIAFGNVNPPADPAVYNLAQYIGAPGTGDYGSFVIGDWDGNGADSFGLFYQNGELFYRNDLDFNSGIYVNQSVGTPFGSSGLQVATWR